jgi:hypothetical protein
LVSFFLIALAATAPGPQSADLVAALECRGNLQTTLDMMMDATNDADYGARRGWTRDADSPLSRPTYHLKTPITVFGQVTDSISFATYTVFAAFPDIAPADMARQLNITPDLADGQTLMGSRVVKLIDFLDPSDGSHTHYKIALQVSNFSLEAPVLRAGCSYIPRL